MSNVWSRIGRKPVMWACETSNRVWYVCITGCNMFKSYGVSIDIGSSLSKVWLWDACNMWFGCVMACLIEVWKPVKKLEQRCSRIRVNEFKNGYDFMCL